MQTAVVAKMGVKDERLRAVAYVGLGSNMGDRAAMLRAALAALAQGVVAETRLKQVSRIYETRPLGPSTTPFLNAVAELETTLSAEDLLAALHHLEAAHHRQRSTRWTARTLDLDLLAYVADPTAPANQWRLLHRNKDTLRLPHPQLVHRDFVLAPLVEVAPEVRFDGDRTASELLTALPETARTILRTVAPPHAPTTSAPPSPAPPP